jgi:hypothetical protein
MPSASDAGVQQRTSLPSAHMTASAPAPALDELDMVPTTTGTHRHCPSSRWSGRPPRNPAPPLPELTLVWSPRNSPRDFTGVAADGARPGCRPRRISTPHASLLTHRAPTSTRLSTLFIKTRRPTNSTIYCVSTATATATTATAQTRPAAAAARPVMQRTGSGHARGA